MTQWKVCISKADMKFSCAHFIAYKGFRERLHGHNYTMSVCLIGRDKLGSDGYLIDFGDVKKVARALCKSLNEYFLCPMLSDVINVKEVDGKSLCLKCEDGSEFLFPSSDCMKLPIVHSSAEEMSYFLWVKLIEKIGLESLMNRGISTIEVGLTEVPGQTALFQRELPNTNDEFLEVQKSTRIEDPSPCLEDITSTSIL